MDEQSEMIRKQMEETKSQLSEKIETLELQIAETVQSTGTAVNATAEAMQETAEAVTEVVQEAALSVSHAFDLRRQVEEHPFVVIGGAVALGYLAFEFLIAPAKSPQRIGETGTKPQDSAYDGTNQRQPVLESPSLRSVDTSASEPNQKALYWHQIQEVAFAAVIGVVQEVVARSIPALMEYVSRQTDDVRTKGDPHQNQRNGVVNDFQTNSPETNR